MARSRLEKMVRATEESPKRRRELFGLLSAAAQVLSERGFDEEPDHIRIHPQPLPVVNPEQLAPLLTTFQTHTPLSPSLQTRVDGLRTGGSSIYVPLDSCVIGPIPDPLGATALPETTAVAHGTRSKTSKK